jgi:glutamate--cysteine ligase
MIPHLITALKGPINDLERRILDSLVKIEHWLRLEWHDHTPPFYSSVDIRNAGFKLAPVDTNLFPGGFNNLTSEMLPLAVQATMSAIEKICPDAKNLLLIPENHTRNLFYLTNVAYLVQIMRQAGLNVRLGSLDESIQQPTDVRLPDGKFLTIEPLVRHGSRLGLQNFDPCTILLNNDLSAGIPKVLKGLEGQYLLPPLHAGWAVRRKTQHFKAYDQVAGRFAELLGLDPWLINPYFEPCEEVDFSTGTGINCLVENSDKMLQRIRQKYKEYHIDEKPFIIVKADAGTYGMGIMTVRDPQDLIDLNRRTRNKMSTIKDGQSVSQVILQEGVPTYERVDEAVAEPVVYMVDRYVVGGFYRVNAGRSTDENLNAPGASFVPLAFADSGHLTDTDGKPGESAPNRFYMYGVIARLAMLAASYELEMTDPAARLLSASTQAQ